MEKKEQQYKIVTVVMLLIFVLIAFVQTGVIKSNNEELRAVKWQNDSLVMVNIELLKNDSLQNAQIDSMKSWKEIESDSKRKLKIRLDRERRMNEDLFD